MSNPLLVVTAYHSGDFDITKQLLEWIVEIGSYKPHSLLLAADAAVPREKARELMDIARPCFHHVRTMIVPTGGAAWPANVMFLNAAHQVQETYKLPFLWLEPDCIPLATGWLEQIADAYAVCPKQFMGPIIHQEGQAGLPADHLTGCSVYPNHAYEIINAIESVRTGREAWDIGAAGVVVPKAENTDLWQHFWGTKEFPPIFVSDRKPDDPKNRVTLDFVRKGAVLFHRSKDGGLIQLLRANRKAVQSQLEVAVEHMPVDANVLPPVSIETMPKRKPGRPPKITTPQTVSTP